MAGLRARLPLLNATISATLATIAIAISVRYVVSITLSVLLAKVALLSPLVLKRDCGLLNAILGWWLMMMPECPPLQARALPLVPPSAYRLQPGVLASLRPLCGGWLLTRGCGTYRLVREGYYPIWPNMQLTGRHSGLSRLHKLSYPKMVVSNGK